MVCCAFVFIHLKVISLWFILWLICYLEVCFLIFIDLWISQVSFCYWVLISFQCGQRTHNCTIYIYLSLLRLFLWSNMLSILQNVPCTLEKNVYFSVVDWKVLCMSFKFIWSILFRSAVYRLSIWMFYVLLEVRYWSLLVLSYCCQFLPSELIFALYI